MDKELIWYKSEIEKRFEMSEMRDYVFGRVPVPPSDDEGAQEYGGEANIRYNSRMNFD